MPVPMKRKKVTFIADYGEFDVTGHFYDCYHYTCDMVSREATLHAESIAGRDRTDKQLIEEFVNMVKNKEMETTYERLLLPVKILNVIYESYQTGKEVKIKLITNKKEAYIFKKGNISFFS